MEINKIQNKQMLLKKLKLSERIGKIYIIMRE
jgi:hypothetical protein